MIFNVNNSIVVDRISIGIPGTFTIAFDNKYPAYISPLKDGMAPIGLVNKYNAPATIISYESSKRMTTVRVKESGSLAIALPAKPVKIFVNRKSIKSFIHESNLCIINLPSSDAEQIAKIILSDR